MQVKGYCAVQMYHLIWNLGLGAWASLTQLCTAQCRHANKHAYMPLEGLNGKVLCSFTENPLLN